MLAIDTIAMRYVYIASFIANVDWIGKLSSEEVRDEI